MTNNYKTTIKDLLGSIPFSAEIFWRLRGAHLPPVGGYVLDRLKTALPEWCIQASDHRKIAQRRKHVLVFGMLRYWIEHTSMLSLLLSALGHEVTLGYLPYTHWKKKINKFDLRRQDLYIRDILDQMHPHVKAMSLVNSDSRTGDHPMALEEALRTLSYGDTQYSLLIEEVDTNSALYRLRLDRNRRAASSVYEWMKKERPDVVIVPNGSILEFGVVYLVARELGITVVTFEFGEQSERLWMAQNSEVMRQDTSDLWTARVNQTLTEEQLTRIRDLYSARQGASLWQNFSRRWQGVSSQGAAKVRAQLGLDERPLALIPTNVLGDSLTIGRQHFTGSMTEWIRRTMEYFRAHPAYQLVIRVHPGEQIGWGPSVYDILLEHLPDLPENIHLLPADAEVNTYDLIEAADVGLVYTTTVGMEMAMSGLPVIVVGQTHYRNKGFTIDPDSWATFFQILDNLLSEPGKHQPEREQMDLAWQYAYTFFFEYPQPFPWHLVYFWNDVEKWPLERVVSEEGMQRFGQTINYMLGTPLDWKTHENL